MIGIGVVDTTDTAFSFTDLAKKKKKVKCGKI